MQGISPGLITQAQETVRSVAIGAPQDSSADLLQTDRQGGGCSSVSISRVGGEDSRVTNAKLHLPTSSHPSSSREINVQVLKS